jgi:hypothetical protein
MPRAFERKALSVILTLGLLLVAAACIRRDGRNNDCKWPPEAERHPPTPHHLSEDAEFAEDLAIRYADSHFGRYSSNPSDNYGAERDQCMAALFNKVAAEHGVPLEQVSDSLGRNRVYIDLAEILSFATLYFLVAVVVARMNWRRYSPKEHGWTPGLAMALIVSFVFAGSGMLLGDVWCDIAETHRIDNSHMSYRFDRLLWPRHRAEFFMGLLLAFWLAATVTARNVRSQLSNGP